MRTKAVRRRQKKIYKFPLSNNIFDNNTLINFLIFFHGCFFLIRFVAIRILCIHFYQINMGFYQIIYIFKSNYIGQIQNQVYSCKKCHPSVNQLRYGKAIAIELLQTLVKRHVKLAMKWNAVLFAQENVPTKEKYQLSVQTNMSFISPVF